MFTRNKGGSQGVQVLGHCVSPVLYRYNTTDVFYQLGSKISQASNEAFLHIPARSVPTGWGAYAHQVYVSIKDRGYEDHGHIYGGVSIKGVT